MSDLVGNPEDRFSHVAAQFDSINDELAGNRIQIEEGFDVKFNTIICQC